MSGHLLDSVGKTNYVIERAGHTEKYPLHPFYGIRIVGDGVVFPVNQRFFIGLFLVDYPGRGF